MNRVKALEDSARLSTELKEAVRHLSENVAALHQAVVKMAAQRNEAMPQSVRIAVIVPSLLVTAASCVWLLEHTTHFMK